MNENILSVYFQFVTDKLFRRSNSLIGTSGSARLLTGIVGIVVIDDAVDIVVIVVIVDVVDVVPVSRCHLMRDHIVSIAHAMFLGLVLQHHAGGIKYAKLCS